MRQTFPAAILLVLSSGPGLAQGLPSFEIEATCREAQPLGPGLDQDRDLPVRKMLCELLDKIEVLVIITANVRPPAVELPRDDDRAVLGQGPEAGSKLVQQGA